MTAIGISCWRKTTEALCLRLIFIVLSVTVLKNCYCGCTCAERKL